MLLYKIAKTSMDSRILAKFIKTENAQTHWPSVYEFIPQVNIADLYRDEYIKIFTDALLMESQKIGHNREEDK